MTTYITHSGEHVITPWRFDLATLIPHAREITHAGERLLVLPNKPEEAKLARNLGVPIPSPILTKFDWCNSTPWAIQRTTAALLAESQRAYVLSTMGTGKTRSVLYATEWLMRQGTVRRVLIASPLSTLTPVWERELFDVLPRRRVRVLHGDRKKRLKLLAEDAEYYIINHHGLPLIEAELIKRDFDLVVLDELAMVFRNKSTDIWKATDRILNPKGVAPRRAWGLTGSPTPNAPTDAWAQIRLLTPDRVARTMGQFQDQTMRKVSDFRWIPRPDANQIVHSAMQPSVRFTLDQVMELPTVVNMTRQVKLGAESAKAYKMLFDKMRHVTQCGQSITAVNEGVLQNKLLQVACGYIYSDKKTVYELPGDERKEALLEIVQEHGRRFIVFVPYVHALNGVAVYLKKKGFDIGVVHGATARGSRDKIFSDFQNPMASIDGIVAHPQTMAHGLTLTEGSAIIWYAPTQSLEIYEQANARIVRPGQKHKCLIAHLAGTAVEKATYARLQSKAKMQGLLLAMFKQQELDY
jgi:SNF2 family DNA or RNA helicase